MRVLNTIQSDDVSSPDAARYVAYEKTGVAIGGSHERQIGQRLCSS